MAARRAPRDVLRAFAARWSTARCATHAAALSFFTVFSLAPILVIVVAVGSSLADATMVTQTLLGEVERWVGERGAQVVTAMLASAADKPRGWYATLATMALLVTATTAFAELKSSLDDVIECPARPGAGSWLATMRTRALSFVLVLCLALLLLALLAANAALGAGGEYIAERLGWADAAQAGLGAEALSSAATLAFFFALHRMLPARPLAIRSALLAAVVTTALFTSGRLVLAWYLGRSTVSLAFGPGASLAIVLLWVYYAALAFLAGAVLAVELRGGQRQPQHSAARVPLHAAD